VDVTVVVATFGDPDWITLALDRAVPSAERLGVPVLHTHGTSLHGARNTGLDLVETEWVCFLDADDELEPGYFDAMSQGTAALRAPAVRYVTTDRGVPRVPTVAGHRHRCGADCLAFGNWLVIGTVAPAALLREVGGFCDWEWSEDWDLWVRCWKAGATVEAVPGAVYRAHVRRDSRNRAPSRDLRMSVHRAIAEANGLPVPA
jgi:glycosyltransferase involved in cell wall biosynthesis